jgi:diketogulonate reductase-like aldo/keto reductase
MIPELELNDGFGIPAVGFGTWPMKGAEATAATLTAIEAGYRLLDTALVYDNEDAVGEAVRRSGIRDELTVTTKIPWDRLAYEDAREAFRESQAALGLDRIDLLLLHSPGREGDLYREAWRALVDLRAEGSVRSIGVSNFTPDQLRRIVADTGVVPAVNQVLLHPYQPQREVREVHTELGIVTESYSPIDLNPMHPTDLLSEPVIVEIAAAHDVTPARAVLRWHVQQSLLPIPKSGDAARQRQNLDVFDFELSSAELDAISALERTDH